MSDEVIQTIAKVAGLAGISIALVFYIFRSIIKKKIFPMLTKAQAYKIINTIILSTVVIALVGIAAWVYTSQQSSPSLNGSNSDSNVSTPVTKRKLSLNGVIRNKETKQPIEGIIVRLSAHSIESKPSDSKGVFHINDTIETNRVEVDINVNNKKYYPFNGTFDVDNKQIIIALKQKG